MANPLRGEVVRLYKNVRIIVSFICLLFSFILQYYYMCLNNYTSLKNYK